MFLGLCAAVSLIPAMSYLLIGSGWLLSESRPLRKACAHFFILGAIAAVMFALCVAPIFIAEPHALNQFRAHAALAVGEAGRIAAWRWAIGFDPYSISLALATVVALCVMLVSALRRHATWIWLRLAGGAIAALAGIVMVSDGKYFYLWYPGAWLLAATVALAAQRPHAWLNRIAFAMIGIGVLLGSLRFARERVLIASLPDAQCFPIAGEQVKVQIPPGSRVLTNDHWVTLAPTCDVYDARFAGPAVLGRLDYVVLASNFGGQARHPEPLRQDLAPYIAEHFRLISSNPADRFFRVLGMPITRGVYGFGADVLHRTDEPGR